MRIFVAWDFSDQTTKALLEAVVRYAAGPTWIVPGVNNEQASGIIGSDLVAQQIREADLVLTFVDKANANVGWELGLAIGYRKQVRLVAVGPVPSLTPSLANATVLAGVLITPVGEWQQVLAVTSQDDWSPPVPEPVPAGTTTCVLCAGGPEGSGLREAISRGDFQGAVLLPAAGVKLAASPSPLTGCARVIWVISREPEAVHRDGQDNASNAVTAGMARAAGFSVRVLCSAIARGPLDVAGEYVEFSGLDEFQRVFADQFAVFAAPPHQAQAALRLPVRELEPQPPSDLMSVLERLFPRLVDIRELAARVGVHDVKDRTADGAWAEVFRRLHNDRGDVGPLVQAGLAVQPNDKVLLRLASQASGQRSS